MKLVAEHILYEKLANVLYKNDIHVNRLESIIFGM